MSVLLLGDLNGMSWYSMLLSDFTLTHSFNNFYPLLQTYLPILKIKSIILKWQTEASKHYTFDHFTWKIFMHILHWNNFNFDGFQEAHNCYMPWCIQVSSHTVCSCEYANLHSSSEWPQKLLQKLQYLQHPSKN